MSSEYYDFHDPDEFEVKKEKKASVVPSCLGIILAVVCWGLLGGLIGSVLSIKVDGEDEFTVFGWIVLVAFTVIYWGIFHLLFVKEGR